VCWWQARAWTGDCGGYLLPFLLPSFLSLLLLQTFTLSFSFICLPWYGRFRCPVLFPVPSDQTVSSGCTVCGRTPATYAGGRCGLAGFPPGGEQFFTTCWTYRPAAFPDRPTTRHFPGSRPAGFTGPFSLFYSSFPSRAGCRGGNSLLPVFGLPPLPVATTCLHAMPCLPGLPTFWSHITGLGFCLITAVRHCSWFVLPRVLALTVYYTTGTFAWCITLVCCPYLAFGRTVADG